MYFTGLKFSLAIIIRWNRQGRANRAGVWRTEGSWSVTDGYKGGNSLHSMAGKQLNSRPCTIKRRDELLVRCGLESIPLALTYDDVLLVPQFSSVRSRQDVDCASRFTRQISLTAPFVSSAMDTVTEGKMAIAVAEFGGIGVIHRFLPIEAQVREVAKVKRYQSRIIEDPYTIPPNATIAEARQQMQRLEVHGLPVVERDRLLAGILTRRDVQLATDGELVSDRMTPRNLAGKWRQPGQRLYLESTRIARAENAGRALGPEGTLGSGPAVPRPRGAGKLLRPVGLDAGPAVPGRRFRRVLLP